MIYQWGNNEDLAQITELLDLVKGDKRNITADQFLVAYDKSKVVGCVRIFEQDGIKELISLGVLEEYRKNGIGTTLVKKILELKSERPIYLLCFKEMEQFYKQFGFVILNLQMLPSSIVREYERVQSLLNKEQSEIVAMSLSKI